MKFLFFIFIILITTAIIGINSLSFVQAAGFSPSSLTYELKPNQEDCKMITINSESETISVSDKWAENKDMEWKVSSFEESANYHDISIDYQDTLGADERELEVCLSGSKLGEYHGVVLLKEEQEGSSIIQMGVWLKVLISEQENNPQTSSSSSGGSSSSSSSGSSSGGSLILNNEGDEHVTDNAVAEEDSELTFLDSKESTETIQESSSWITGAVIGVSNNPGITIGIVLIVLMAITIAVYNKKKNNLQ
ncbi:MAG: hypothetical protein ABIB47_00850, partial [Candidatus Woesearchaeota archaeon]